MKKNYNLLIGVAALVAILVTVSVVGYQVSRPRPVVIQGEAEATEYRVSGKVPGRIEEFRAMEGQMVRKGDTLVIIDSPEIRSKIAEANAAHAAAVSSSLCHISSPPVLQRKAAKERSLYRRRRSS